MKELAELQAVDVEHSDARPDVAIEKKTKRYPSDLTDEEWSSLTGLLPQPAQRGRKRTTDLREVVNALRYMVRSGCELAIHGDRC